MRGWLPVLLLSLSLPAFGQNLALPAGQSQFTITQNGKTVGHTESNIVRLSNGYSIESHGDMSLGRFQYSFTSQNRLDPMLNVVQDQITGTVNGKQASFDVASSTDGRQFIIHASGGGKNESNTVTRHQNLVVVPDFDAAAYVEMVHFAMAQPQYSWVLIPKGNGILVPCGYVNKPDVQGTLYGRSVVVRHTTVVISAQNAISIELYYTTDGTLMEADLPEQNFYVIRNGFQLLNRPASTVPHVGAPPQQQQQQQQNGQPQQ
jgi:hypothetical protein